MVRFNFPEVHSADLPKNFSRVGSCFFVEDEKYILMADGRCNAAADRAVKRLGSRGRYKILFASHSHYDHLDGINDAIAKCDDVKVLICQDPKSLNKGYSDEAKGNVEALERLIKAAKSKKIAVVYAEDGSHFQYGEIEFVTYRDQPSSARNTETYINQGSICLWFPKDRILYTADTGAYCVKEHGLNPVFTCGHHHGNWLGYSDAKYAYDHGCLYYWDDDYSERTTEFLKTGRGNAKKVGMIVLSNHSDTNIVTFGKTGIIYKNGKQYRYACSNDGKNTMKRATLLAVYNVFSGKYGTNDARVTKLLDLGFNPGSVQGWVNKFAGVVK